MVSQESSTWVMTLWYLAEQRLAMIKLWGQHFSVLGRKTLNKAKCSYAQTTLDFFGYTFSDGGFSPDPKKVQAMNGAATPTNSSEVRSLLGMANYSARFIKDFATITQPLRELAKKVCWMWTDEHQKSLDKLKQSLTSDAVMTYFNPYKLTELVQWVSGPCWHREVAHMNQPEW